MIKKKSAGGNKNRLFYGILILYFFIAIFASLLANEKPLLLSVNGKIFFPAFSRDPYIELPGVNGTSNKIRTNNIDWKNIEHDLILFPPVCWSPNQSDLLNTYSSPFSAQKFYSKGELKNLPFRYRHFLGTGKTGNDVMAGLIHGTRTSISIGFFSISIAILLGIFLGGIAGYFGDNKLKVRRGSVILSLIMIIPAMFYSFYIRSEILKESFSFSLFSGSFQLLLSLFIFLAIFSWPYFLRFSGLPSMNKKILIPADSIISRFIEIFLSLPRLILILTLAAITRPSITSIIIIIGITSWTETARLMRAQVLQLRELNYIEAARTIGMPSMKIIIRHLLPNTMSQVTVIWTLGIASAILIETGLSFLGIGVPVGTATWGSLMYEARENYQAWWLVIFTGAAIVLLLSTLYFMSGKFKTMGRKIHSFS